MTEAGRTRDEEILVLLCAGPAGTASIAERLGWYERSVRRRLRRLIKDGYVFSPERGRYRITAAGVGVMTPVEVPGAAPDRLQGKE
jgi:predicted transcriptional regulator